MRGKKSSASDEEELVEKRAGFVGMRGKKSATPFELSSASDEREVEETEKALLQLLLQRSVMLEGYYRIWP